MAEAPVVLFLLKLAFAAAVGAACFWVWRWTARIWRPLALVLGLGILLRAASGVGLFVISYYSLPLFQSLQAGDGFWQLAPDARVYFDLATDAALGGEIRGGSPSPAFLEMLGWWLRATGLVPSSAVLFNLALYVASCAMVLAAFRPLQEARARQGALITLSALSFSPILILLGTQSLKDVFSAFLTVLAGAALMSLFADPRAARLHWKTFAKVAAVALGVYLMAGVRAYYAMFIWGAVALALLAHTVTAPRPMRLRSSALAAGVLAVLWLAFMWGAGPYYAIYGNLITRTIGVHLPMISPRDPNAALPPSEGMSLEAAKNSVDTLRLGFIRTGGATNIVPKSSDSESAWGRTIRAVAIGMGALYVPVTILTRLSLVEFSGGRGVIFVTDLDTLFIDIVLVATAWVFISGGAPTRRQLPFLCFALVLGVVSSVLMAYIVTNYGTLVRLRLLATVPLWLVPLALRHLPPAPPVPDRTSSNAGSNTRVASVPEARLMPTPGAL